MQPLEPPVLSPDLSPVELSDLRRAKVLLENPGLAARLAHTIGAPIEKGFELLPKNWAGLVQKVSQAALLRGLRVALVSLGNRRARPARLGRHKVMAGVVGGVGGAFGLAALPVELPVSTTLILRSIADIARSEGLPLQDWSVRLACLEVFALGGRSRNDDAADNAYWAVRTTLAQAVSEAAAYMARRGVVDKSAPVLVRLVAVIAARFGVVVSEQIAAKAVPVVGAAAGSAVNVAFMTHFQSMARGHFIVKRLESKYGERRIREVYESMAMPIARARKA